MPEIKIVVNPDVAAQNQLRLHQSFVTMAHPPQGRVGISSVFTFAKSHAVEEKTKQTGG